MIGWLLRRLTGVASTVVEAAEELRIHRGRVLLSLIGVGVAVCALATVVAVGGIAEQAQREAQERSGGRPATYGFSMSSASGEVDVAAASAAWRTALERHGIDYASRNGWAGLTAQFADGAVEVQTTVVDPDYGALHRVRLSEGAWFTDRDAARLAPAIIVNDAFWQRLGRPPLSTHPTVELLGAHPATAVVMGVTPKRDAWDTMPSAYLLTDAYLPMLPPTADPMYGPFQPSFELWIPDDAPDELAESVQRTLESELGPGTLVSFYRSDYGAYDYDPFLALKLVVGGVAGIILLLGALGLLTIALVTVRARIREIGIRRTFGATAGRVFFSVLMETVVGTFIAGVVGVGIAIALVRSPLLGLALGGGVEVQDLPGFPIDAALIGIGAAVLVGALAGIVPALTAVRVRVIDAIRF